MKLPIVLFTLSLVSNCWADLIPPPPEPAVATVSWRQSKLLEVESWFYTLTEGLDGLRRWGSTPAGNGLRMAEVNVQGRQHALSSRLGEIEGAPADAGIYSTTPLPDGSLLLTGTLGSSWDFRLWWGKTDPAGHLVWQSSKTQLPPEASTFGNGIIPDLSGGYFVTGTHQTGDYPKPIDSKAVVVRVNSTGEALWTREYSFAEEGFRSAEILPVGAVALADGGIAVALSTRSDDDHGGWVLRLDDQGREVWRKRVIDEDGRATALLEQTDPRTGKSKLYVLGDYEVVCHDANSDAGDEDYRKSSTGRKAAYLARLDTNTGALDWTRDYFLRLSTSVGMLRGADGKLLVLAAPWNYEVWAGYGNDRAELASIDSEGAVQKTLVIRDKESAYAWEPDGFTRLADGSLAVAGHSLEYSPSGLRTRVELFDVAAP